MARARLASKLTMMSSKTNGNGSERVANAWTKPIGAISEVARPRSSAALVSLLFLLR